jgi:hypothetical protein
MAYTTIDDPSAHFQTATFAGNGSTVVTVTNDGNSDLSPDLLWFKRRDDSPNHVIMDTTQGANITSGNGPSGYNVPSNPSSTAAQVADSTGVMTITSDGFTSKEMSYASGNVSTGSMCCWQWKMNGGTSASNTDGNITSTVQANTTAGQSIVTWTGNEQSAASVGHGLDQTPEMVFFKRGNSTYNWVVWLGQLGLVGGNNMFAYLNLNNAAEQAAGFDFTSTLLKPGSGATTNSGNMFAYCFHSVKGYSKFGTYIGNASADGPFVYTGFKPAFVLAKIVPHAGWDWAIMDNTRTPTNANGTYEWLWANLAAAEFTDGDSGINMELDFLSNGFKIRTARNELNYNGAQFIYMCFAEQPFVTSTGIPTTAR